MIEESRTHCSSLMFALPILCVVQTEHRTQNLLCTGTVETSNDGGSGERMLPCHSLEPGTVSFAWSNPPSFFITWNTLNCLLSNNHSYHIQQPWITVTLPWNGLDRRSRALSQRTWHNETKHRFPNSHSLNGNSMMMKKKTRFYKLFCFPGVPIDGYWSDRNPLSPIYPLRDDTNPSFAFNEREHKSGEPSRISTVRVLGKVGASPSSIC